MKPLMDRFVWIAGLLGAVLTCVTPAGAQVASAKGADGAGRFTVMAEPVPLRLETDHTHLTFHLYEGASVGWASGADGNMMLASHRYTPICTAPCDIELGRGRHRMGLSRGRGMVLEVPEPVDVREPATLVGHHRSRAGIRIAGWTLLLAGSLGGAAMIPVGTLGVVSDHMGPSRRASKALLGVGAGLLVGSLVASLLMITRPDEAWIEVIPHH